MSETANPSTSLLPHLANSVVMVRPIDFGFNQQTGADNEFQHKPSALELVDLNAKVNLEFDASIETLTRSGIETVILEKKHTTQALPDAVFPNNWFSTTSIGQIIIYPMKTNNRKAEVQTTELAEALDSAGYQVKEFIELSKQKKWKGVLEGTGSLIFHQPSQSVFTALSERCQEQAIAPFIDKFPFNPITFNTRSSKGKPIYHTNVLMSCGENFAVIADQVIVVEQRGTVLSELSSRVDDIIIISEQQMTDNFCGNILQLKDSKDQPVIALSNSAYRGFTGAQIKRLEKHASLAVCSIPLIEKIGGGSTRCMLAENFLPKRR